MDFVNYNLCWDLKKIATAGWLENRGLWNMVWNIQNQFRAEHFKVQKVMAKVFVVSKQSLDFGMPRVKLQNHPSRGEEIIVGGQ